jgi:MFS family permease
MTHDPYAALRSPSYRRVLAGNVLSALGAEMQSVAVGWELYARTNDALALGLVGLVQFVPVLLLSIPAGHTADHFSRKGQYIAAQVLMALSSAGLAALSFAEGPVPWVYVCLGVIGVARAFSAPARWSIVPQLVPPEALGNAVTWNSSGWQVASMSGPALGGWVVALTGRPAWAYVIACGCALTCAGLIVGVRLRPFKRTQEEVTFRSLLAGLHFIRSSPLIVATLTLDLFAVLLGGATALLPVFARDILALGPTGLGWLRAAPSIGALCMALTLAHRAPMRRAGRALLLSVAGFGVATIGFGLSRDPYLSFALLALTGALDNVSIVVRGTLVQLLTPDAMRGRVSAVNTIFIVSSNELGAFESGVTAYWFGPIWSVVGGGVGTVLVVLIVMRLWPQVRRLGPLHEVSEVTAAEPDTTPAAIHEPGATQAG